MHANRGEPPDGCCSDSLRYSSASNLSVAQLCSSSLTIEFDSSQSTAESSDRAARGIPVADVHPADYGTTSGSNTAAVVLLSATSAQNECKLDA